MLGRYQLAQARRRGAQVQADPSTVVTVVLRQELGDLQGLPVVGERLGGIGVTQHPADVVQGDGGVPLELRVGGVLSREVPGDLQGAPVVGQGRGRVGGVEGVGQPGVGLGDLLAERPRRPGRTRGRWAPALRGRFSGRAVLAWSAPVRFTAQSGHSECRSHPSWESWPPKRFLRTGPSPSADLSMPMAAQVSVSAVRFFTIRVCRNSSTREPLRSSR